MKARYSVDSLLMSVVLLLLGLGVIAVYSSSCIYALDRYDSTTYFLWRQLTWIGIGAVVALFFIFYDYRKLRRWVKPLLLAALALLVSVLIFGREISGARRWLRFSGIGFQPSEFTKLILIIFVAYYCDRKKSKLRMFSKGLLPVLFVVCVCCGLIFMQPDLGTPLLIFATCLTMIFIAGGNMTHIGLLGFLTLPFAVYGIWLEPYRQRRLLSFLNPWKDMQGDGYQLVQSLLAIGSGGVYGVGLGGSHSKLLYLPEPHTDFIFPIFAEEFGLIGTWALLLLFAFIAFLGFRIAKNAATLFGSLLASGISLLISYQAVFNIGVVTGCLPTKGIPLPFISFGGSSMVVALAGVGILLNIARESSRVKA